MRVEHRHSYGVIPLIGTSERWKILLIDQRDPVLAQYWTFSKGTPEPGESPRATAIRETKEEVGITCDPVDDLFLFTDSYTFERDGTSFEKSVTYFAGRAPSEAFELQATEVRGAKWCTPEEALTLMTFTGKANIISALRESGVLIRLLH